MIYYGKSRPDINKGEVITPQQYKEIFGYSYSEYRVPFTTAHCAVCPLYDEVWLKTKPLVADSLESLQFAYDASQDGI